MKKILFFILIFITFFTLTHSKNVFALGTCPGSHIDNGDGTCNASYRIVHDSDDSDSCSFYLWNRTVWGFGYSGSAFHGFVRWSIDIPKNSSIKNAFITIRADVADSYSFRTNIRLLNYDSCAAFNTSDPCNWVALNLNRSWNLGPWSAGVWYITPNISHLVQGFIDRAGYSTGNYIGIRFERGTASSAWKTISSYKSGAANAAWLNITYKKPCTSNGGACSVNGDCCSGYCRSDYDGVGSWCANSDQCAHDGVVYNNGQNAPDCYDISNRRYCNAGTWTYASCGADTTCTDYYCNAGACSYTYQPTTVQCNPAWTCSSNSGDNYYNAGGNYRCQGYCDGGGSCDYAGSCTLCGSGATNLGDTGDEPLIGGYCHYDTCSAGECTSGDVYYSCGETSTSPNCGSDATGDTLTEVYASGASCPAKNYNCDSFDTTTGTCGTGTDSCKFRDYSCTDSGNQDYCGYTDTSCDICQYACEKCKGPGYWNLNPTHTTCCGDDANEYKRTRECASGICVSNQNDDACCSQANNCVYNSVCYSSGTSQDVDADGLPELCSEGTWGVSAAGGQTITIYPGWNLVSIQYKTVTGYSDPCRVVRQFYAFNKTTNHWDVLKITNITGGRGYWMYSEASTSCDITISGSGVLTTADIPQLKTGYNLIGVNSTAPYYISDMMGCSVSGDMWYWNAQTKNWESKNLMDPSRGYWVKVSYDCSFS